MLAAVLNGIGAITKIREAEERGEYGGYRHTVYALTGTLYRFIRTLKLIADNGSVGSLPGNARKGQIDAAFAAGMDDVSGLRRSPPQ